MAFNTVDERRMSALYRFPKSIDSYDYRAVSLFSCCIIYALFGSPTPDQFSITEITIAVLLCLLFRLGAIILLYWYIKCLCATLTVTNMKTILRKGLLSKYTTEVWHHDVRNVQIQQSFFQRMYINFIYYSFLLWRIGFSF